MPQKLIDMSGEVHGMLKVICRDGTTSYGKPLWKCKCECGNYYHTTRKHLLDGSTYSCGCYRREFSRKEHTTHGKSKTRLYRIWTGMKDRCLNPKSRYWDRYGGSGITLCNEWIDDFESFRKWSLENGYEENLTIDRKDNSLGYSPENCRWATYETQENNRTNNVLYSVNGEILTLAQLSRKTGLTRHMADKKFKEERLNGNTEQRLSC